MELYVARDKDGTLAVYPEIPERNVVGGYFHFSYDYYLPLDDDLFPEITWENSPKKVELKLVKE